jgi:hypothetical protein
LDEGDEDSGEELAGTVKMKEKEKMMAAQKKRLERRSWTICTLERSWVVASAARS